MRLALADRLCNELGSEWPAPSAARKVAASDDFDNISMIWTSPSAAAFASLPARRLGAEVNFFVLRMVAGASRRLGCPRRPVSILTLLVVATSLAACASRPETGFLTPVAVTAPGAAEHTLLVATTRERDDRPGTYFNGDRSSSIDYAEISVSVPPSHQQGKIEWPSTPPGDPKTDFVVRDARYLDGDKAFVTALNAQLAMRPPGSRKVFLFIHGFNTLFSEGLYRLTQLVEDSKAPGVPVLFTWASRGKPTAYVYDTNSATMARDELEHTLRLLANSNAEQVNILAHSMGNWVTVETFRQIKIAGKFDHADKLGYVFLAAPDIDIDVFKSEMRRIGSAQALLRHRFKGRQGAVALQDHRRRREPRRRRQ